VFVIDLTLGMLAGSLIPSWLVLRQNLRDGVAAFGIAAVSIVILALPFDLSARAGTVTGLALGFFVAWTVIRSGSSTQESQGAAPPSSENQTTVDSESATLES
jgi:hypothetical protein